MRHAIAGAIGAAGLVMLAGCETTPERLISSMTGSQTTLSRLVGGDAGNLATQTTMQAVVSGIRDAQEADRRTAERKAAKQLEPVPQEERDEMSRQGTYVAVKVDEKDGADEVMVVDPKSGKAVDNKVHSVRGSRGGSGTQEPVKPGEKIDLGEYEAIYVD